MTSQNGIRIYQDKAGKFVPSRLDSYLYAKTSGLLETVSRDGYLDEDGLCKYCRVMEDGRRHTGYMDTPRGVARCICWLLDVEKQLIEAQKFSSFHKVKTLRGFQVWGGEESRQTLNRVLDTIQIWMGNPTNWLLLRGRVGTGKSHILQAIDGHFCPWSLYISAPDFEDWVFKATDERTMDETIAVIRDHPILLIDDIGSDYGSKYPKAILRAVVDWRYRRGAEYPVVGSTNFTTDKELYDYDSRTADRLLDMELSGLVSFSHVSSWRTQYYEAE